MSRYSALVFITLVGFSWAVAAFAGNVEEKISSIPHRSIPPDKALATYALQPLSPLVARQNRWEGSGVVIAEVSRKTGIVTHAYIAVSSGHKVLDQAALDAYRQWRFKPGSLTKIRLPFTYKLVMQRTNSVVFR